MRFEEFEKMLEEMVSEVPDRFMEGLQGVHVIQDAKREDEYEEDVYRLGEYLDPGPEDFLGAGDGIGRHVAIYYGSFLQIALADPDFDWEEEAWETLTHELRHHVESLAGEDFLVQDDVEASQDYTRRQER